MATWPCSRCRTANPLALDSCAACGAGFLAAVRDDEAPLLALPGIGDLATLGRGKRMALAGGVVAAVLVPLALLTVLLSDHGAPAAGPVAPVASASPAP